MYGHPVSPGLLVHDPLPPTFAVMALLAAGSCDAPGRRLARLACRTFAPRLVDGTLHRHDRHGLARQYLSKLRVFMG
jgi:hypothetical protein